MIKALIFRIAGYGALFCSISGIYPQTGTNLLLAHLPYEGN
jgi:hypothetical protein